MLAKYSSPKTAKEIFTLLQHLDWAVSRAKNYADDVKNADFSKIGNDELLIMVAHGPDAGKKSGDYTGKDLATFLCDKKKGLPSTWKKKTIMVTSCFAAKGGNASVIDTMADELGKKGKKGITIIGCEYETVTHKDVNPELYAVIDKKAFDKVSNKIESDPNTGKKILSWINWVSKNTVKTLPELATETSKQTKDAYVQLVKDANKVKALDSEKNKCRTVTS